MQPVWHILLAHLQLLPPHYNFYDWKSETYICDQSDTLDTSILVTTPSAAGTPAAGTTAAATRSDFYERKSEIYLLLLVKGCSLK